eukprot:TRINITY_DN8767_c0_g1_i1.p1 TRINITY_DN8767_c0_g1~~TRINITY_DN8767_c0_g1_i1.p1  ORF type:complete len:195 (-),score=47.81 TRINITY_DN8767_c0_g1_i1:139-723(-)
MCIRDRRRVHGDYPVAVTSEERKLLLRKALMLRPKLKVVGGTTKTNPYKAQYDMIVAERRAELEYYKNSILWSPRYTPKQFKYLFFYPAIMVFLLMLYIRYVAVPKRMMELKNKYGYVFPELEAKGWLKGWMDDDDDEIYTDWTLKDVEAWEKDKLDTNREQREKISRVRSKNIHAQLEGKFAELYKLRKENGL